MKVERDEWNWGIKYEIYKELNKICFKLLEYKRLQYDLEELKIIVGNYVKKLFYI